MNPTGPDKGQTSDALERLIATVAFAHLQTQLQRVTANMKEQTPMKDTRTRAELKQALAAALGQAAVHEREAQRLGAELATLKSSPPRIVEVLPAGWPAFIGEAYAAGFEASRRRSLVGKSEEE
jgi:hypothetical protein